MPRPLSQPAYGVESVERGPYALPFDRHVPIEEALRHYMGERRAYIEALTDHELLHVVGCGIYGCVFVTADPQWVVKVTTDPDEGRQWQLYYDLQQEGDPLPAVPIVEQVFALYPSIRETTKPQPRWIRHDEDFERSYVIVRENVTPLDEAYPQWAAWLEGQILHHAEAALADVNESVKYFPHQELTFDALREVREGLAEILVNSEVRRDFEYVPYPEALGPVLATLYRLAEMGSPALDLHSGNFGWDGDRILLTDPSGGGGTVVRDVYEPNYRRRRRRNARLRPAPPCSRPPID